MQGLIKFFTKNKRPLSFVAAFLLAFDLIITMMASGNSWFIANAAMSSTSLADMKARAENIINYEWVPSQDIRTWNNSLYNGSLYFKKGETVKGMPFTLFYKEVASRSLMSLGQYANYASRNYSATARCESTSNAWRTGPVYGSCCASFVSEVLGDYFAGPRYISVRTIAECPRAYHYKNVRASSLRVGDAIDKTDHIVWIGDITDKYYVVYEQTPPIARKTLVPKSSAVSSQGYFVHKGIGYKRITRVNVTNTTLNINAPEASATHDYYAENASARINWNYQTNASYYILNVKKDGEVVINELVTTNNFCDVNKGNGSYEVTVTAVCGYTKKTSEPVRFEIGRLDAPVIKTKQKYYATGDTINVEWNSCTGATGYQVSAVKDGESQYLNDETESTSYSFAPEDGYYEFVVNSVNANGGNQVAPSKIYGFNIGNKRPVIIDPSVEYYVHGAAANIKWNDCEGVSDYVLKITKDGEDFLTKSFTGCTSFTTDTLEDGYYEALVTPGESRGEYDWQPSEPFGFYVGKLDKPVAKPDKKYSLINSTATVSWKPCEGAVKYHVAVESEGTTVYEEDLSGTAYTFDVTEGKYSVRVTSINTNGGYQQCVGDPIYLWAVTLDIDQPAQTLKPGETVEFSATVSGGDPEDSLEWITSDSRIASVTPEGVVTAEGPGTASVSAKLGDLEVPRTIDVVPDLEFETLGASIRLSEPYGIRFGVRLGKNEAFKLTEIVEYGTLIIGAGNLGSNELTLDTDKVRCIKAENYLENTNVHVTYTGVLINIPKSFFDTKVVGRGYLKYRGADGNVYTMYSTAVVKSFNGVAQAAYDSYSKLENPNAAQKTAISKLKEFLGIQDTDDTQPADGGGTTQGGENNTTGESANAGETTPTGETPSEGEPTTAGSSQETNPSQEGQS